METDFVETLVLEQTQAEVRQRFAECDDLAHGWEHIERVYALACFLAERENADLFIVGMAALLHDLGRAAHAEELAAGTHHADLSVTLATHWLQRQRVPVQIQDAILHAILAHSFSKGIEPHTIEARVVRDADRLDGLGAIGILRWALTGAVRHTSGSYHPEDPFAHTHELDDKHYMLDHFYTKLLCLADTMTTQTGRIMAQQRTAFMQMYLSEFQTELEVCFDVG